MEALERRPTALLDTNVVLDVLLERYPFFDDSDAIWKKCDDGMLDGYVTAVTVTTIFYVGRKLLGVDKARQAVRACLQAFRIAPVYREMLDEALLMPGTDFEDNVQIACAHAAALEAIITRDTDGFKASTVPAVSPHEMLQRISSL